MGQHGVTNKYVIHVSASLCYRLLYQETGKWKPDTQPRGRDCNWWDFQNKKMVQVQRNGVWSQYPKNVHWKDFSPVIPKVSMGLIWFTEPCHWKGREMSSLHVSRHAFGGQTQMHFRTSKFKCVFIPREINHWTNLPRHLRFSLPCLRSLSMEQKVKQTWFSLSGRWP